MVAVPDAVACERPYLRGLYAGSFDPPTIGHLSVIKAGAVLFDELHVAVAVNPAKTPTFSVDERAEMLIHDARMAGVGNVTVGSFVNEFAVNYAARVGCSVMLRGLRSADDFNEESTNAAVSGDIRPEIGTVFVPCPPELARISSSLVKGLVGLEEWEAQVSRYVSPFVLGALKAKYI
jgi:pantetheine-phosphate adenylyltransferase